jgi:hypothetical protein
VTRLRWLPAAGATNADAGILARCGSRIFRNEPVARVVIIVFMALYYAALITGFRFHFLQPVDPHGLTFNSMLEHLLHGRFDVDPKIVADEGFSRNGRVYAYFGIICALLRLPLLAIKGGMGIDVTTVSCLIAACLAGAMKLEAALFARRHVESSAMADAVFCLLLIYIVFGGAQVGYLQPTIYQEVVWWSVVFAAGFVYGAVRGLILGRFSASPLGWMAVAAGLALICRVTFGIGLYLALGLLLVTLLIADAMAASGPRAGRNIAARLVAGAFAPRLLLPALILLACAAVTGIVNYQRWGSATEFANYDEYISFFMHPERIASLKAYGLLNMARIPFALGYYFLPVWVLPGSGGALLFQSIQDRMFDVVELPPSSFFLTDLMPIALIVPLAWSLTRANTPKPVSPSRFLALATGLVVPWFLMLALVSLTYRYRMEFYPALDLFGFTGFYLSLKERGFLTSHPGMARWLAAATVVSVLSAHVLLFLYKMRMFGPSQIYLREGVFRAYYWGTLSALRHSGLPW